MGVSIVSFNEQKSSVFFYDTFYSNVTLQKPGFVFESDGLMVPHFFSQKENCDKELWQILLMRHMILNFR